MPQKKQQHYKFKGNTREHLAKEPQIRDHSVDSGSTLASFAKRQVGVELSNMYSSDDEDNKKPSGKGESKPSGKGAFSRRDFARERGGKPQNVAQSVGRRVSLPDRQSQQTMQSHPGTSEHQKR